MMARNARYLFGCGSLAVQTANDAEATYEHLKKLGVIPQPERVFPLAKNNYSGVGNLGVPQVPPLVELYLKFGATVLGRPAYDPVFRCYDLFVFFDMQQLTEWGNELIRRFDARLVAESTNDR
jgi:putative hemolysin